MKTSDVLKAGLARLGVDGDNWSIAGDCMATALIGYQEGAIYYLGKSIGSDVSKTNSPIWYWNDTPGRTWSDVKAKYLEAIALAEADEISGIVI